MESKIRKNADGSWDFSQLSSLRELEKEILIIRNRLQTNTNYLKTNAKHVPKQALNTLLPKTVSSLLGSTNNSVSGIMGMLVSLTSRLVPSLFKLRKKSGQSKLAGIAKAAGFTLATQSIFFLYGVFSKWNKRRKIRKELRELIIKEKYYNG